MTKYHPLVILDLHKLNADIRDCVSYMSDCPIFEYSTCVREDETKQWYCMKGAYERTFDSNLSYQYYTLKTLKLPKLFKESIYKNHVWWN